jgi:chloramphenicol O-acetyltransferase
MGYMSDAYIEIWEKLAEDDEFLKLSDTEQQEAVEDYYNNYQADMADAMVDRYLEEQYERECEQRENTLPSD